MIKKLLKTFALCLMALTSGSTAWAERDTSKPIYSPTNGGSYDNIKAAYDAIKDNTANELVIEIWGTRPTLGADADSRITSIAGKTLSIVPKVSGIILTAGSHNRGNIWFLNNQDNATVNIGSADYAMTIEGYGFNDNNTQLNGVCVNEKKGTMNITNVTFQKFRLGSETKSGSTKYGYLYTNKNAQGYVAMTDVTITNCETANEAFIKSISTNNDAIYLINSFKVSHKEGKSEPVFHVAGRIRLGAKDGNSSVSITTSENITLTWAGSATTIGTAVVVKAKTEMASKFELTNADLGLFGNDTDLKLTQAYTLAVNNYGASTLVLPFASTIPAGVKAYKASYTQGAGNVTATEVEGTLSADTPVLINANGGNYKFVSTATDGTAATGSGTPTAGALVGTYADNTAVAAGNYVLYASDSNPIGFYKAGTGVTIGANRAYLKSDGGSLARLNIMFGDETTAVDAVKAATADDGLYYNLQGVRVANPTKGIYVKNGKKMFVK